MTCGLIDLVCHAQNAAWEWWAGVGLLNKVLIVLGLLAVILGALSGFLRLLHSIGGWPAVGGAAVAVLGLILAVLPRKPKGRSVEPDMEDGGDQPVFRKPGRTARRGPVPPKSLSGD